MSERSAWWKPLAKGALVLALTYGCLELVAFLGYRSVTGAPYSAPIGTVASETPEDVDRTAGRERAGLGFKDPAMSLHPYLGYVYTPPSPDAEPPRVPISPEGFLDVETAFRERDPDSLLVGLMGGSVAGQLGTYHSRFLVEAIESVPEYSGRSVELVRLGMPGYHQPQQALQLVYLLAQGLELDLLLNVDGFNEVSVPAALNLPQGAHPLFPMNWSMVALDTPDLEVRRLVGAVDYLRESRNALSARKSASRWSWSPLYRLTWKLADRQLETQAAERAWRLQQLAPDEVPFFVHGAEWGREPEGGLLPWLVDVWRTSSLTMEAICDARGIRYAHFLQPNQYLPGSKPLSAEERAQAVDPEGPYKPVVEEGYPLLIAAGVDLRAAGVDYHDLSRVFATHRETLYKDNCCHYNTEGNRVLADAIGEALAGGA